MKKSFIILALAMMAMLFGCGAKLSQGEADKDVLSMFVKVEDGGLWDVYYHKDTKVMYVVSDATYNTGTFTVLVNADGSPMLWEE